MEINYFISSLKNIITNTNSLLINFSESQYIRTYFILNGSQSKNSIVLLVNLYNDLNAQFILEIPKKYINTISEKILHKNNLLLKDDKEYNNTIKQSALKYMISLICNKLVAKLHNKGVKCDIGRIDLYDIENTNPIINDYMTSVSYKFIDKEYEYYIHLISTKFYYTEPIKMLIVAEESKVRTIISTQSIQYNIIPTIIIKYEDIEDRLRNEKFDIVILDNNILLNNSISNVCDNIRVSSKNPIIRTILFNLQLNDIKRIEKVKYSGCCGVIGISNKPDYYNKIIFNIFSRIGIITINKKLVYKFISQQKSINLKIDESEIKCTIIDINNTLISFQLQNDETIKDRDKKLYESKDIVYNFSLNNSNQDSNQSFEVKLTVKKYKNSILEIEYENSKDNINFKEKLYDMIYQDIISSIV